MINKSEMLLVVDQKNHRLSPRRRQNVHQEGLWHRTSHIWVHNDVGDILCQRRSLKKDTNPGLWEPFFGGHLGPNVSYRAGATTELAEELGIPVPNKDLRFAMIAKDEKGKEFQGVFTMRWNGKVKDLRFERDEVDALRWFSSASLASRMKANDPTWTFQGYAATMLSRLQSLQEK